ncbi:hypothetical protein Tco_0657418 [Tanacetum coccineum]|uniref:Uncharacterized protein n=1 Tax=Tanacetum coccineum TaxID=301880 RepID=A0ABQ4XBJ4_9ASTR
MSSSLGDSLPSVHLSLSFMIVVPECASDWVSCAYNDDHESFISLLSKSDRNAEVHGESCDMKVYHPEHTLVKNASHVYPLMEAQKKLLKP